MTGNRDSELLVDAASNLAGVIVRTDRLPYLQDAVVLHALAAAGHLSRVTAPEPAPESAPAPVSGPAPARDLPAAVTAVEDALRAALRSLALLSPATFDSDDVLDTIRELQSALAATG